MLACIFFKGSGFVSHCKIDNERITMLKGLFTKFTWGSTELSPFFHFFEPCGRHGRSYSLTARSNCGLTGKAFRTAHHNIKSSVRAKGIRGKNIYVNRIPTLEVVPCKKGETLAVAVVYQKILWNFKLPQFQGYFKNIQGVPKLTQN